MKARKKNIHFTGHNVIFKRSPMQAVRAWNKTT
jgi:hypothetical protein